MLTACPMLYSALTATGRPTPSKQLPNPAISQIPRLQSLPTPQSLWGLYCSVTTPEDHIRNWPHITAGHVELFTPRAPNTQREQAPSPQGSPFIPTRHEEALLDTDSHAGIAFDRALHFLTSFPPTAVCFRLSLYQEEATCLSVGLLPNTETGGRMCQ